MGKSTNFIMVISNSYVQLPEGIEGRWSEDIVTSNDGFQVMVAIATKEYTTTLGWFIRFVGPAFDSVQLVQITPITINNYGWWYAHNYSIHGVYRGK